MNWWEVARTQAGMIGHAQLLSIGHSGSAVQRMHDAGELIRFTRGVYLAGAAPLTFRARLWGVVLATDGLIAYDTAGHLWGMRGESRRIHVTVPHARRIARPPGAVVHRVPVPTWARTIRSELPVTTRAWTVLDLMASLRSSEAAQLADRAVQRGWLTAGEIDQRVRLQPGRTGNRQLRLIAASMSDGAAAQSERLFHRLLRRAGVTQWSPNYPVWVDGELVAVVDVALPHLRVAIEIDGMAYHVDVDRFQRDRHRQNDLVGLGWTVLRFTWWDLTERPGYVLGVLRRLGSASPAQRN